MPIATDRPTAGPDSCESAGDLSPAMAFLRDGDPARAWTEASAAIDRRPFHPDGFLLLADLAARGGDPALARRCALRAVQLTPSRPAAVQCLRRLPAAPPRPTPSPAPWIGPGPCALRRDPLRDPSVSVCMIVRNEERFLDACLRSVRGLASQLVVVDTGSTDRTVEIARAHGAEVRHFEWCDDFAAARNAGLACARGDWILVLDADEEISAEGREALASDLRMPGVVGLRIPIVEAGTGDRLRSLVPRLARNAPGVRFQGRIHEEMFASLSACTRAWGLHFGVGRTTLIHHGYSAEIVRDRGKAERNLKLLDTAVRGGGAGHLRFQLALELCRAGRLDEGLAEYARSLEAAQAGTSGPLVPETREMLLAQYTTFLQQAGRPAEVERVLTGPLALSAPLSASLVLVRGIARLQIGDLEHARADLHEVIRRRSEPSPFVRSAALDAATPELMLGWTEERARDWPAAETAFSAALARDPSNLPAACGRARVRAASGDVAGALAALEPHASAVGATAEPWVTGARIALDAPGLAEVAETWTAVACARFPEHAVLQSLRATALLHRGLAAESHAMFRGTPGVRDAATRAASVIAAVASGGGLPELDPGETGPVSVAVVAACAALRRNGATGVLESLHAGVARLDPVLPAAAAALRGIGGPATPG